MERFEIPAQGWTIDLVTKSCPCRVFNKFGHCSHLLFAFKELNLDWMGNNLQLPQFVNRTVRRGRYMARTMPNRLGLNRNEVIQSTASKIY